MSSQSSSSESSLLARWSKTRCSKRKRLVISTTSWQLFCSDASRISSCSACVARWSAACFTSVSQKILAVSARVIGVRDSAAGEDDIVDITRQFPRIFRLQDPRITHAKDLCRVLEVMKSDPQPVNRSIHRLEHAVIDGKPAPFRLDGRSARTDLHFLPALRHRPHDELRRAPKAQVRRIGNPNGPRRDLRMRTVKPGVESAEFFWENHYIPVVCLGNERDLLHMTKVFRLRQRDLDPVWRVDTICDEVLALHAGYARIFDAELAGPGNQKKRRIGRKVESIAAAREADN